jgi:hypothetical protein
MSMHEVICATCGAINQAEAEICWRCLASLREVPAAADAEHAGSAEGTGTTKTVARPKA